jgi:pilus assembly protein Flp/PilA
VSIDSLDVVPDSSLSDAPDETEFIPRKHETPQARLRPVSLKRRHGMNHMLLKLFVILQTLRHSDEGQDLVEYGLMLTLISLALISGINGIARAVNITFSNISSSLA